MAGLADASGLAAAIGSVASASISTWARSPRTSRRVKSDGMVTTNCTWPLCSSSLASASLLGWWVKRMVTVAQQLSGPPTGIQTRAGWEATIKTLETLNLLAKPITVDEVAIFN